jgi:hypothetical protein
MKKSALLIGLIVVLALVVPVAAYDDYEEYVSYKSYETYAYTPSASSDLTVDFVLNQLGMYRVQDWNGVTVIELIETGSNRFYNGGSATYGTFTIGEYASGNVQFVKSSDDKHDRLVFLFDTWDFSGITGVGIFTISYTGGISPKMYSYGSTNIGTTVGSANSIGIGSNERILSLLTQVTYATDYKAHVVISELYPNYTSVTIERTVDGETYYSTVDLRYDNDNIYINNDYDWDNLYSFVDKFPSELTIRFGSPVVYTWEKTLTGDDPSVTPTPTTVTPTPTPTLPGCDKDISLSLNKYTGFFPYEYITGSISLTGDAPLDSISWMVSQSDGIDESKITIAQFNNVSGTWYVWRNDLGNVTPATPTTYEDALSESIRFASSGYKTVMVGAFTQTFCNVRDEKQCNVYPISAGTNLHINFRDCINGNLLGFATASIENIGRTGNVTYSGNPISISANPGDILSIYATSPGYTPNHVNYTVLSAPSGGNSMEVPFYLCPEEMDEIYPGNTTLIINVKSLSGGQSIEGASVHAGYGGTTISSTFTNSAGYSMLQIPYHEGYTKVDVASYPYNAQTKYLQLLDASSYEDTFYLTLGATTSPTPTPTPSSTSPWFTPTQTTMTTAPTSTTTSNPKLVVVVSDATTGNPMAGAEVKIYWAGEYDETYKDYRLSAMTGENGKTSPIQMYAGEAYYCDVSASGYYTSSERFLMADSDSTRYVQMIPLGSGVTTATTTPPGGLPNIDIGDGNATGWVSMFIDKVMELFGVNEWAARVLLGLLTTLIGAVFVGGCLAGYGSGEGAGMGALIGGCFGWIASTILGFIPVWLLPVSIAFVGLAFFVWRGGGKE